MRGIGVLYSCMVQLHTCQVCNRCRWPSSWLVWLVVYLPVLGAAQPIDSLEQVFRSAPNDSVRMRRMIDAGAMLRASYPVYSLQLATNVRQLAMELNRKAELAQAENLLGMVNEVQGDYKSALTHYLRTYDLVLELKKPQFESTVLNNLAIIYEKFKLNAQAFDYYSKALAIDSLLQDSVGMTYTLLNMGFLQHQLEHAEEASVYYLRALKLALRFGVKEVEAALYHNMGNLKRSSGELAAAENLYQRAVHLSDSIQYHPGLCNNLMEWAALKRMVGQLTEAYQLCLRAERLAQAQGLATSRADALRALAELSAQQGNLKVANQFWTQFALLNDSLKNLDSKRLTEELLFKFDVHQKNRAIDQLNQLTILQQERLEQERLFRFGLLAGGFILVFFLGIMLYQVHQKRKANRILNMQRGQLESQALALIAAHNETLAYSHQLEQVNADMTQQHEVIEQQHRSLIDSLEYAYRIQQAMLPDLKEFRQAFPDSFVFYRPKAIVSGDFYWIHISPHRLMVAVVDCTGHGAPGAFMAVLGNSLLNQIVLQEGVESPGRILKLLDIRVQAHLHHQRSRNASPASDGMELAVCRIDRTTDTLTFAGANRPLYRVRAGNLTELRGSKAVVSGHIGASREPFMELQLDLQAGDCVYLCSDGFADQLGGEQLRRKFSSVRLKRLLQANSHLNMVQQKMELRREINQWRGRLPFIDDVLVMGFSYPDAKD